MAVPQDTDVHLETVETADVPGRRKLLGLGLPEWVAWEGAYSSESLLENGRERCSTKSPDQRKTDKLGLLRSSHSLSVTARQLLKTPCTEQYERWWCAMQGTQKMKAGPSTEIEQANLSNHSNAAVVKTMVVSD